MSKVTQLGGDRVTFKLRQSDARACSGNDFRIQCYWKEAERKCPSPTRVLAPGEQVAVAVVTGPAGVGGFLEEVDV